MSKIYVTKPSMPPFEEYVEEIKELWDTHVLTNMGNKHKQLEKCLKEYLGIENISLMVNGHMALEMILQALNVKGEVITTPFTFVSTTHAIVRNGLTPVFCDINDTDLTIDVNKIEGLITEKTTAIMPVHVYGRICDVKKIDEIAQKYKLKVIYDAAHAFAAKINGCSVLNYGDASTLSFHATKVFNTIEGGAVIYHNPEIGKELYRLKNFGFKCETEVDGIGANAKLDEFRAAMGLCNLKYINKNIQDRKKLYEKYKSILERNGIKFLQDQKGVEYNYSYCPVIFDERILGATRDDIYNYLKENGVYTRRYFYPLVTDYECYNKKYSSEETPVAKYISDRILCLPIYADLDLEDVEKIGSLILKYIKSK